MVSSGMVGLNAKVGEEQGLAAGMCATTIRLDGHKHGVNLRQRLGVIGLQDPTLLVRVVLIEDAEIHGMIPIRPSAPRGLECACAFDARLLIEIVCIEMRDLPLV